MFELASPTGKSFRFVRAWRDATRDHYSVGPGAVQCGPSSSSPAGLVLGLGLAWLGLASVLLLLLLRACVLGFRLLASVLLLLHLRARVLGFWLLSWLLAFGSCSFGF